MKRGYPSQRDIYNFFGQTISKMAIVNRDGEWVVQGKWSIVALDEQTDEEGDPIFDPEAAVIDIWICNPSDMCKGLGQKKVRNMLRGLNVLCTATWRELNGEAWGKTTSKLLILEHLSLLGIRRKRSISEQQRRASAELLRRYRHG